MAISKNTKASLMAKANVHMVWTAKDGKVVVGVTEKVPLGLLATKDIVPGKVRDTDGIERDTDVVQVGKIYAREYTKRKRPCPGGHSVGHKNITAGTLGMWVYKDGTRMILSNNHVLANSNEGVAGDVILQPGPADGGSQIGTDDLIGHLHSYVVINHEGGTMPPGCQEFLDNIPWPFGARPRAIEQPYPNLVDCALGELWGNGYDPSITGLFRPAAFGEAAIGDQLAKTGRTTETTGDPVEAVDLSVQVQYGSFTTLFDDQIMVVSQGTPFSQGGDSGSAVLRPRDRTLVGLLFAGGTMEDGRDVTIVNKIGHVHKYLGGFEL